MKASYVICWIVWALLILSCFFDLFVLVMSGREINYSFLSEDVFHKTMLFMGGVFLAFTFVMRLILKVMFSKKTALYFSGWGVTAYLLGSLLIYGACKCVEIFGMTIFFQVNSLLMHLIFAVPAVIAAFIHLPIFVKPKNPVKEAGQSS